MDKQLKHDIEYYEREIKYMINSKNELNAQIRCLNEKIKLEKAVMARLKVELKSLKAAS